jgi:hypothetical protein
MNAPTSQAESTAMVVAERQQFDLSPRNFEQALTFAQYMADSALVPKDFMGKPGNCLIAIQWGAELGIKPLQAVQNIAIINGRPSLWGDVMLALVRASPLCEYVVETVGENSAVCKVKRRGEPEQSREFTVEDATKAKLLEKDGPWKQYRKRMLQMRARAWALRDVFTDVLKGLHMAEEAMDMPAPEKFMGTAEVVGAAQAHAAATVTHYPQDQFDKNLPAWRDVIAKGRKTADQIIAMAETKHPLTDDQKKAVREKAPVEDAKIVVTFAQVAEKLNAAANPDQLADAGTLIGEVADPQQRTELTAMYERRGAELNT